MLILRDYLRGRRAWTTLTVASCILTVLLIYSQLSNLTAPALPPLPGTYQYFKEIDFHSTSHRLGAVSHCDARFALDRALSEEEFRVTLRALMDSYAATMQTLNADTWLAHGTLLGWYWNHKFLPWDTDIDVHMSYENLSTLAADQNMTSFEYQVPGEAVPRKYLLDINPFYSFVTLMDRANHIDARWIDQSNGKFLDITAMHRVAGSDTALFCKDGHRYDKEDIYPLLATDLEGIEVKIPAHSEKILREEYSAKSLTNTRFHWYKFNPQSQLWEPE